MLENLNRSKKNCHPCDFASDTPMAIIALWSYWVVTGSRGEPAGQSSRAQGGVQPVPQPGRGQELRLRLLQHQQRQARGGQRPHWGGGVLH